MVAANVQPHRAVEVPALLQRAPVNLPLLLHISGYALELRGEPTREIAQPAIRHVARVHDEFRLKRGENGFGKETEVARSHQRGVLRDVRIGNMDIGEDVVVVYA